MARYDENYTSTVISSEEDIVVMKPAAINTGDYTKLLKCIRGQVLPGDTYRVATLKSDRWERRISRRI